MPSIGTTQSQAQTFIAIRQQVMHILLNGIKDYNGQPIVDSTIVSHDSLETVAEDLMVNFDMTLNLQEMPVPDEADAPEPEPGEFVRPDVPDEEVRDPMGLTDPEF